MILISHRGNLNGKKIERENHPDYIDEAINLSYDVEIDVWVDDDKIYLGHDNPDYSIELDWLVNRIDKLWLHCKNTYAITFFSKINERFNFFWHEEDLLTLTSNNYIWVYPGKQPIENSIAVLPEINDDDISKCLGICSDFVSKYNF